MKNKVTIAAACLTLLITGCKKSNLDAPSPESPSSNVVHADIESQDGLLRFKSRSVFEKTINQLEKNEKVALPSDFTSLADLFLKVCEAEISFNKTFFEKNKTINTTLHSDLYNSNNDAVFYTELKNGESILEMDLYSAAIAKVVNRNGLVLLNDSLFIFSKNKAEVSLDYTPESIKNFKKNNYQALGINVTPILNIKSLSNQTSSNGPSEKTSAYCYNDDYHYNTTVWNYNLSNSYQVILEVFVEQTRYNNNYTNTKVYSRGRFLTRFPFSGSWIPYQPTDMYFGGSFSGPRSPSNYERSNPYSNTNGGFGTDLSVTHCYDYGSYGNSNCFSVSNANYQVVTAYAPFSPTYVIW